MSYIQSGLIPKPKGLLHGDCQPERYLELIASWPRRSIREQSHAMCQSPVCPDALEPRAGCLGAGHAPVPRTANNFWVPPRPCSEKAWFWKVVIVVLTMYSWGGRPVPLYTREVLRKQWSCSSCRVRNLEMGEIL